MTSAQGTLNRFLNSSAVRPSTRIIFLRLLSPDAMVTEARGTFKRFAKNSMQASLARPSLGGAVKETLRASPTSPVIAFFFARGWSLMAKLTPVEVSRIGIIPGWNLMDARCCATSPLSLSIFSFAKDRRSHPHTGRAFLNGDFKVVRHSHRKHVHIDIGKLLGDFIA